MTRPANRSEDQPLRVRIEASERQLLQHRSALATRARMLESRMRTRITSPTALLAAAGVGFALEQASRERSLSLLYLFNTLTHGGFVIWSLLSPDATTPEQ